MNETLVLNATNVIANFSPTPLSDATLLQFDTISLSTYGSPFQTIEISLTLTLAIIFLWFIAWLWRGWGMKKYD